MREIRTSGLMSGGGRRSEAKRPSYRAHPRLYRGMSHREIVGHLRDLYGIEVSPDLISAVTDAVLDEIAAW
jgi:hypothetical protein